MKFLLQLRIWNWGFWLWFFLLSVSPALAEEQANVSTSAENVFEKFFAVTSDTSRSPLTPLKKGETEIKVSLFKGDLEGSKTFDTDKRTFQTSSEALLAQNTETATEMLQVTAVKANPTEKGVEIILQTDQGQQLQITNRSADNSFIADIPNAQLRLPSGDAFTFRSEKPIEGITEITVTNFDANTIRVTVVGQAGVPVVELFDSPDEGLIFSVASTIASTPSQQPEPSQPERETQPEQPSTQGDEPIELVVTGEQDGYRVPNASTATKTDTPLRDIPGSIQVIPRQVLDDQQATSTLKDALRNVSGVNIRNSSSSGSETYIIRGFDNSTIFQDGIRLPFVTPRLETANLEQIEVLKGPASVLFGEVQPGGIVNLVSKKPLAEPFYSVGFSIGSYDFYRSSIDFSGPLTADRSLRYRLNAVYENAGSFRDFYESERFFVAPTLTWDISKNTNLTLLAEYLHDERPLDRGLVAFGRGVADIPFTRRLEEPGNFNGNEYDFIRAGYILEHRFSPDWSVRNTFQVFSNRSGGDRFSVQPGGQVNETTGLLPRILNVTFYPVIRETYSLQTDVVGNFTTGAIKHKLLFGLDIGRDTTAQFRSGFRNTTSINIFNPIYGTVNTDNVPITFDGSDVTNRLGVYLQDQITLFENLKLLIGGRFDIIDLEAKNNLRGITTERYDDAFSPRVGIVYQPIEPISLYASFSQSLVPNSATRVDNTRLEPQRGTQYEVGVKGEFLDGRLSATLAGYKITKSNVPTQDLNNLNFFIPVGEQRSRGIELDVTGQILPGWNIIASYAYTDAEVSNDTNRNQVGNRLQGVPKHSASLWTTYEIQRGNLQGLGFGAGLFFVGDRFGDVSNSYEVSSYVRTDATIYYRRENFKATLGFKNLFDVEYIEAPNGRTIVTPGIPFTVVGSVSWEF